METLLHHHPSPVIQLQAELFDQRQIDLLIKRDDLLQPIGNPLFCGNKVRKLKYNLQAAQSQGFKSLLTFGGAFSNHIAAVAAAGKAYGFETVGVIRGEAHLPLNPTLAQAQADGMQLHYLDRDAYRKKDSLEITDQLRQRFGDAYWLPEGGTNELALQGSAEMISEIESQLGRLPDYLCAACGTGGTLAGMIRGSGGRSQLIGISALKGDFMQREVEQLVGKDYSNRNWSVNTTYHFGGYARFPAELRGFVSDFERNHGVLLDPVYTAKLFYGVWDLIGKGYFPEGSSILVVHSGGLQGWGGMEKLRN